MCEGLPHSQGFCNAHYRRWWKYGDPLGGRTPVGEPLRHFEATVMSQQTECLLWPYATAAAGYGQVTMDGTHQYVHVVACERWHGPKPRPGMEVCHGPCVSKLCYNGAHLRWGTRSSNLLDRTRDGVHVGETHWRTTITEQDVREIRARREAGEPLQVLATEYGMAKSAISRIANRKSWGHVS